MATGGGGGAGGGGAAIIGGFVTQPASPTPIARTSAIAHTRARDSRMRNSGSTGAAGRGAPPEKHPKTFIRGSSLPAAFGSAVRFA